MRLMRYKSGFTLVELVITMVLVAILAGLGSQFVTMFINGYVATTRRAELARFADVMSRRLSRDIQAALPNSVRVTAGVNRNVMEFVPIRGAGIYRSAERAGGGGDTLQFDTADTSFDVLGPVPAYSSGNYLVISNFGDSSASDFYGAGTVNRTTLTSSNATSGLWSTDVVPHNVQFAAFQFPVPSVGERFYITDSPVSYICDTAAKTLTRYSGYGIFSVQQTVLSSSNSAFRADILASNVDSCVFRYAPGVTSRTGLVTMEIMLASAGETVDLMVQAHVIDLP